MWIERLRNLASIATRSKPAVGSTPADVIFAENRWRLLRYRSEARAHDKPVLLVPSLINRHYVLDLMPGKSFAEWLLGQGWDVFVIDWGTPGDEDRFLEFDEVVDRYLGRALRRACKAAGSERAHVLGYCLGGTLAAIHAALRPERVASLCALAAPVRFTEGGGMLETWTQSRTFDVRAMTSAMGNVPWQLMQAAFHMLRPTLNLSKTVHLVDRAWDDEFLDGFLAIETWGNDNVALPGAWYVRYIEDLYVGDKLAKGELSVSGERVELAKLTAPTQVVSFEHDNIVPKSAAIALLELSGAREKKHVHLPGGHVGAVVSKSAAKRLWPEIDAFFASHDAPKKRARKSA